MDRKRIKDMAKDQLDMQLNGQDLATMLADLEIKTMELANKIDMCKNKKTKQKLEKRLQTMTALVTTIASGNVSFMTH